MLAMLVVALVLAVPRTSDCSLSSSCTAKPSTRSVIDGFTFASSPGRVYVAVREAAEALGWTVEWDTRKRTVNLEGRPLPSTDLRALLDGTQLVDVDRLADQEQLTVTADSEPDKKVLSVGDDEIEVRIGEKRVEIDLASQELCAWQGDRLLLRTHVSTGAEGHRTPAGRYRAGPVKERMHFSRLYDNAPMPWSVQIGGNLFIHGYASVPDRPASHGCVRMPLAGDNPARWFYWWVDVGTPVEIVGEWRERDKD